MDQLLNSEKGYLGQLLKDEPLAPYLSYKIGGPAKYFLKPKNLTDIKMAVDYIYNNNINFFTLGSGSNLVANSNGFNGAVLYLGHGLSGEATKIEETQDSHIIYKVPSHWTKSKLLRWSIEKNLSGLEFSAGIPGTLGGAVFMNAGTKWGSYSDVIESVDFYSPQKGHFQLSKKDIKFEYRGHNTELFTNHTIITNLHIKLKKTEHSATVKKKIDEILKYRGTKQPLELPNCGSVFKNPPKTISQKGAGRLIEACKLKGLKIGGAQISLKHANFILNTGSASSDNIKELIYTIQKKVFQEFNVKLETEVIPMGFEWKAL